jgi:hypothetical protein
VKWIKVLRGFILGIALIIMPFVRSEPFGTTRSTLVTVAFVLLGIVAVAFAVRGLNRLLGPPSIQMPSSAEPPGLAFVRKEREERERAGGAADA